MMDRELALRYLPRFWRDRKEPFPVDAIGYSVIREPQKSPSSTRELTMHTNCEVIIEYAVFFDFDIQHLYDLEHVFVYLDRNGTVVDVESSFHGWFFKSMFLDELKFEDNKHPILYMQPGKHAIMPNPKFFYLYRELFDACGPMSGSDGFLVANMFEDRLKTTPEINKRVKAYIQKNYWFEPTMEFVPAKIEENNVMPFDDLYERIVSHMHKWLEKIEGGVSDG